MKIPPGYLPAPGAPPPQKQVRIEILSNPVQQQVVIRFSFAIEWTAFTPDQAMEFAKHLIQKAQELKGKKS